MQNDTIDGSTRSLQLPKNWEREFSDTVGSLWCGRREVDVLLEPQSSLQFLRDYVSPSRPCIIQKAILDPNTQEPLRLTLSQIMEEHLSPDTSITVDVTPDGHGDCLRTRSKIEVNTDVTNNNDLTDPPPTPSTTVFVYPKQVQMTLREFQERLQKQVRTRVVEYPSEQQDVNGLSVVTTLNTGNDDTSFEEEEEDTSLPHSSVVYYSRQNDCLRIPDESGHDTHTKNITNLASLFPSTISWAAEAFGTHLDAVNIWMGNQASVSSMHKDHYENLFYVASGTKVFVLCPPCDAPFLDSHHIEYPTATFEHAKNSQGQPQWGILDSSSSSSSSPSSSSRNTTRWIHPNVSKLLPITDSNEERTRLLTAFPHLKNVHPVEITVSEGELLYVPALWFHRVTQTEETIGINYWYDMRFDHPLWCYFQLMEQIQAPQR